MTELVKHQPTTGVAVESAPVPQSQGTKALVNLEQQAAAMGNAMKIAEGLCCTGMVPKAFYNKPAEGAAAILYGAELGLNAIQSLQQIMVINGKPGIETRTAVALLKAQGYEIRTVESSDKSVTVEGIGPHGEHETSTWDIARATQAGYTSNKLYQRIPQQMLYAKAAMEVARKIAPHVLSGIAYSTEELNLEPVKMTSKRLPSQGGGLKARLGMTKPTQEPAQEQPAVEAPKPEDDFLTTITATLAGYNQPEQVKELIDSIKGADDIPAGELEQAIELGRQRWNELSEEA